jgi:hypothetical protein
MEPYVASALSEVTDQSYGRYAGDGGASDRREETRSSSREGSHLPALTDLGVTVSRYPALVIPGCQAPLTHFQWKKSLGYWLVTRRQAAMAFV